MNEYKHPDHRARRRIGGFWRSQQDRLTGGGPAAVEGRLRHGFAVYEAVLVSGDRARFARSESRRRVTVWLLACCVIAIGLSVAFRFDGAVRIAVIVAVLVVVFPLAGTMLRNRSAAFVDVTSLPKSGSWPAGISLHDVVAGASSDTPERNPMLLGRLAFDSAGATWIPGRAAIGSFNAEPIRWESDSRFSARRLPGIGAHLQLNIDDQRTNSTFALRLWKAGSFPLPAALTHDRRTAR